MKSKKVVVLFVALVAMACCLAACTKKNEGLYFNNFVSQKQYSGAEQKLSFSEEVSVFSYDVENDVFVTVRPVLNNYVDEGFVYLYGLASATEEYKAPSYHSVISINGDYAIVTKPAVVGDSEGNTKYTPTIGVVKFRGENSGDLTGFMTAYNNAFNQFSFVGDYIACPGTMDYPFSTATFTTFYDYSQGVMLEEFRVRCDYRYEMAIYDKYLVAKLSDHAFFYDVTEIQTDGYLTYDPRGVYIAYPEDTEAEYSDNIEVDIFYIGNGWFSRTARLKSTEEFSGYNIVYEDTNLATGESTLIYANIRCDFYNAATRSVTDKEWLIVDNVANSYYTDYYAQISSYLNNSVTFDEETGIYDYSLPYMDVSAMVKEGYSIVYYYYFPYIDSGSYQSEITFCIMDANADIININDMLMPAVFVDGIGTETSDPLYSQYYGSVHYFDKNLKKAECLPNVDGANTYATFLYHGKGVVVEKTDYATKSSKYGVVGMDGRIIVPFEYKELTPFYGEYALGSKAEGGKKWYRITEDKAEELSDVVSVRQGVYVFERYGKLGLKNYAGDILLDPVFEKLDVYEVFLTGGTFQSNYVVTVKDGISTIYTIF